MSPESESFKDGLRRRARRLTSVVVLASVLPTVVPGIAPPVSATISAPNAVNECSSGFGIHGTITANGSPVSGARVTVASNFVDAAGPHYMVSEFNVSTELTTANDGSYAHCGIDTSGLPAEALLSTRVVATPPAGSYGSGAGKFAVTIHEVELGTLSQHGASTHDVSLGLRAATASGRITDTNGDLISGARAVLVGYSMYSAPEGAPIAVNASGEFWLASTSPQVTPGDGSQPCWYCLPYSVTTSGTGHVATTGGLGFFDVEPYAVWGANITSMPVGQVDPTGWNDYTFELNRSNLTVSVVAGDTSSPLPFSGISGYMSNPMGQCSNMSNCYVWGYTGSDGTVAMSLPQDGIWELSITPPFNTSYTRESYSVVVESGNVVSIRTSESTLCGSTSGGSVGGDSPTDVPTTTVASSTTDCTGSLTARLQPPNFSAIVRSITGAAVGFAGIEVSRWTMDPNSGQPSWRNVNYTSSAGTDPQWGGNSDAVEGAVLLGLRTGTYKFRVSPPWTGNLDVAATVLFLDVAVAADGTVTSVEQCRAGESEWSAADCSDPTRLPSSTVGDISYFDITMRAPNLRLQVCASVGEPCVALRASASLQRRFVDPYMDYEYWNQIAYSSSDESGRVNFLIEQDGEYRVTLEDQAWENTTREARTPIDFTATTTDGTMSFTGLGTPNNDRFEVRFAAATLRGRVLAPESGASQASVSVDAQRFTDSENCQGCTQHVGWAYSNENGEFGLVLPAGDYRLRLNPQMGMMGNTNEAGLARTDVLVTLHDCNGDGVLEVYRTGDRCGTPLAGNDGVVDFTLAGVNFSGTLFIDEANRVPVEWSSGNVRVQSTDEVTGETRWEWTDNWFEVRSGGRFALALTEAGRFRVEFQPPYNSTTTAVRALIEVDVACSTTCTVTPVDPLTTDENGLVVFLGVPNVSGTLTLPDTGSPVPNSWVNVEKWTTLYCWEGCYTWDSSLDGTHSSTRANGEFGVQLDPGSYRLSFGEVEGYSRTELKVLVDATGNVCTQPMNADNLPDTGATCSSNQTPFSVQLGAPNFTGIVRGGADVSSWSGIQFHRWNPDHEGWDWTNIWANTNQSGRFAVRVETAGFYKVTFEPEWDLTSYSAAVKYLVVCESGPSARVALVADQAAGVAWDCPTAYNSMSISTTEDVALVGTNLSGRTEDQTGAGVGDVWIGLLDCGADDGTSGNGCSWQRGVNTRRIWGNASHSDNGRFGLTVLDTNTGDAHATRYQLEVNPPSDNSQGFVRQRIDVFAYSGWGAGASVCLSAHYDNSGPTPTCTALLDSATPYSLLMTTGNISGRVVTAEATCASNPLTQADCPGIGHAWIEVQKWGAPSWDTGASWNHWQWVDSSVNSNPGHNNEDLRGNFSLNITENGLYRITANPSWDNSGGYARKSVLIRVNGDNWCAEPGRGDDFDSSDAEPFDTQCDPATTPNDNVGADSISGLTMRLIGSNLLGRLYSPSATLTDGHVDITTSSKKVGDVWLSVERETTQQWCSDLDDSGELQSYCTSTWWNHVGGSNAVGYGTSKGDFAISVTEAGSYRLRVGAPWNWDSSSGDSLAGFTEYFTVTGAGCTTENEDPSPCSVAFNNSSIPLEGVRHLLKYPSPNVSGTLYSQAGTPVGGTWVSVSNETTGEWLDGVSTTWSGRNKGRFSLLLTPPATGTDTYRLEFSPPWDRPQDGTRRVIRVTVDADGTVASAGFNEGTQNVTLGGITLQGGIYYQVNEVVTPMRYAWVEAEMCTGDGDDPCATRVWTESRGSERNGTIRMGLEDGKYAIRVHPNWGLLATSPMELRVEIVNDTMTSCVYVEGGSCMSETGHFEPDFHHVPPNARVAISGTVNDDRLVFVQRCSGTDCSSGNLTDVGTYLAAYDPVSRTASVDLRLDFPVSSPDHYLVRVLVRSGEAAVTSELITTADDDLSTPTASFTLSLTP